MVPSPRNLSAVNCFDRRFWLHSLDVILPPIVHLWKYEPVQQVVCSQTCFLILVSSSISLLNLIGRSKKCCSEIRPFLYSEFLQKLSVCSYIFLAFSAWTEACLFLSKMTVQKRYNLGAISIVVELCLELWRAMPLYPRSWNSAGFERHLSTWKDALCLLIKIVH